MKSNADRPQKRLFYKRVYIICCLISLLYAAITVGIFFFKSREALEREWHTNTLRLLEQEQRRMDNTLEVAFNIISQLKSTDAVLEYSSQSGDDYNLITQVYQALAKNKNAFTSYGLRIDLLKPKSDLVITSIGTINKEKYYGEMGFTAAEIQQIDDYMAEPVYSRYLLLQQRLSESETNNYDNLSVVKKEISANHDLMFVISFYEHHFYPTLADSQTSSYSAGGALQIVGFGVLDDGGLVSSSASDTLNGEMSLSNEMLAKLSGGVPSDSGTAYGKFRAFERGSAEIPGMRYLFLIQELPGFMGTALSGTMIQSGIVFSLLLCIGAAVALLASSRIYKPIGQVAAVFRGLNQEKPSMDELSFITETAISIASLNDSLKETISTNRLSLKQHFLRELLYGMATKEQIRAGSRKYELEPYRSGTIVVVMEFIDTRELEEQVSLEASASIQSGVFRRLMQALKPELEFEAVELGDKRYALMIGGTEIEPLKKSFIRILAAIELDIGLRLVAAVGRRCGSLEQAAESYRDANRLLNRRFPLDQNTVITVDDAAPQMPNYYYYPLELERELISLVFQRKRERVFDILDRMLDENFVGRQMSAELLSRLVFAIDATVHRMLQQMNRSAEDLFGPSPNRYEEWKSCESRQELREKLHELFGALMNGLSQQNEQMDHSVAARLLEQIHLRYNEDLSLSEIAEQHNLSLGYVSVLFKKYAGENFKDYLNQYRVRKAKEMLDADKELSIKEVAQRVGCNHVNTFIRIFNKYEGISPGQYAKRSAE